MGCRCGKKCVRFNPALVQVRTRPRGFWIDELQTVLDKWQGTPYVNGARTPRLGASCYGFVVGVMDELHGLFHPLPQIPIDLAFNAPVRATRTALRICDFYPHVKLKPQNAVEPGDVLLVRTSRGVGHAMIVGADTRKVWHADNGAVVHYSGFDYWKSRVVRICRSKEREQWQRRRYY